MSPYVICDRCHREMIPGGTCKPERGVLRWGEWPAGQLPYIDIEWNCHDCGVAPGAWHHAGCLLRYDRETGEQL